LPSVNAVTRSFANRIPIQGGIIAAVNAIAISTASKVLSESSSVRSELESVRSWWFWLLIACTAIVAIGVLLEVAEDWFPLGKPVLDMNTGISRPSPSIRWRRTLINLGWKLVMLGVIGEGIFEVATSGADEMLQQFNNTLLAITTDRADSASKSADIARRSTDELKLQTAKANERAALANERAEKEAKARVAMLAQLEPRYFTAKQLKDFVDSIGGRITELNVYTLPDPEASIYAFEVICALQQAKVNVVWHPVTTPYFMVQGINSTGVTLYESPNKGVGKALMTAFEKADKWGNGWFTPGNPSKQDRGQPPGAVPLASIPSPALFIALKPFAFASFPACPGIPGLKFPRPPWNPK
jgi:hypothetical protein